MGIRGNINSGGGSPKDESSLYKSNGTGGPVLHHPAGGIVADYSEVREMDNEESSETSSNVPEYNDYVMFDKAQREKILNQVSQIRANIEKVRNKVN